MQRLRRLFIWLSRVGYCRGFGIQSPTDYRFVRYVVNEHAPYYQYEALDRSFEHLDADTRRLCRLYFRLANYCQANSYLDITPDTDAYAAYVSAGCRKSEVITLSKPLPEIRVSPSQKMLVRCTLNHVEVAYLLNLMEVAGEGSVVIVQDIHRNRENLKTWKSLFDNNRVGAAYDLFYCGIIILDKRRYKKKYIINF